jgi:hypothetical protein
MFSSAEVAIIKTLSYSDVFDYPLNLQEIEKWIIQKKDSVNQINKSLHGLFQRKVVDKYKGYYFLIGKKQIVMQRLKRKSYSQKKMHIAQKVAALLHHIPSIQLIGITGALSMENGKKDDDIDILIITKKGTAWTTRFIVTCIVDLMGRRRKPGDIGINNKICLNMYLDDAHLDVSTNEQNLFSAHEVLQMKVLWQKNNTYEKFIRSNPWAKKFLPNAYKLAIQPYSHLTISPKKYSVRNSFMVKWLNSVEWICRRFQLWYMKKRRTTEKISDGVIQFHPRDMKNTILLLYQNKLHKYGLER